MYYASLGFLATAILVIINFDILKKPHFGQTVRAHEHYRAFLFSVLNYYITDIFWGLLYSPSLIFFCYINTVLYFAAMALSIFFWTRYVIKYIRAQNIFFTILKHAGFVFLIFSFIAIALNFFIPVLFWFDSGGIYHQGKGKAVTLMSQIILFSATALYMMIATTRTKGAQKRRYRAIWFSSLTMTLFIILQRNYVFMPYYTVGFIIATCIMHTFVLADEKETRGEELEKLLQIEAIQEAELNSARNMAFTDPLTGVKNKNAYIEDVSGIEKRIEDGVLRNFGLVVFDVNGLKLVNDTKGHEEGDNFIKNAGQLICKGFEHSPIYRIGGDEFVAFLMGEDFNNHKLLIDNFNLRVEKNKAEGKVTIACGYDEFDAEHDDSFLRVFERADRKMYERKKELKGRV